MKRIIRTISKHNKSIATKRDHHLKLSNRPKTKPRQLSKSQSTSPEAKIQKFEKLSKTLLDLPHQHQDLFYSKKELVQGASIKFFQLRDDYDSCAKLINTYIDELPRVLILPEWHHLDSTKLLQGK
jgi:hypothetical protein